MPRSAHLIPICLGQYERGDKSCDGPRGAPPCSWRSRCVAFRAHLTDTDTEFEDHLELVKIKSKAVRYRTGWNMTAKSVSKGYDDFVRWTRQLATGYNVSNGTKPERGEVWNGNPFATTLYYHITRALATPLATGDGLILPGQAYLVDRLKSSGYATLYLSTRGRHDSPLIHIRPLVRFRAVKLTLPFEPEDAADWARPGDLSMLELQPEYDGLFHSRIERYNPASLGALLHMYKSGKKAGMFQ